MLCSFKKLAGVFICSLLLIAVIVVSPVMACYSGLVIIPTADTIGNRQYGVDFQMDGAMSASKVDTTIINTEYGFGDRIEAGIDLDESNEAATRRLFNAKFVLARLAGAETSIASGVCNLGQHIGSNPYLVASREFPSFRAHFGTMRLDSKNRWFAGVERAVNDRLTLMADYTNGLDNYSSVGFNYQMSQSKSLLVGIEFPNGSGDSLFSMHFVMNGFLGKL